MKIALCEDDNVQAELFGRLLDRIAQRLNMNVELDIYNSAEDLKIEFDKEPELYNRKYEVYFLDIELGEDSGIELADYIKSMYKDAVIVFITSHTDYMQNAFDLHAYNYIVKPASDERLSKILKDIHEMYETDTGKFTFKAGKEIYAIPYSDIIYIQSDKRYLNIGTVEGMYKCYGKIDDVADEFSGQMFGNASKNCIFNYRYMYRIDADVVWYRVSMEQEAYPLDVSRRYYKNFVAGFNRFAAMEKGVYKHLW